MAFNRLLCGKILCVVLFGLMVYCWSRPRDGHRHAISHLCAGIVSATVERFRRYDGLDAREELWP
jgi:hypothetical protein